MKRCVLFALAIMTALAFNSTASAVTPKRVVVKKTKVVATHNFIGTVLWVDPVRGAIALKVGEDEVRFKVVSYTTMKRRGKVVVLGKYEAGDKVTVAYRLQRNTKIATAIF